MNILVSLVAFIIFTAIPTFGEDLPFMRGGVEIPDMVIENNFTKERIKPGGYLSGSFFITIPRGWHVYALGEKKYHPLTFLNKAGEIAEARFSYPPAETVDIMGEKAFVYQGRVEVIVEGAISKKANEGPMVWRSQITWQSCSETVCLPPETRTLEVVINVGE